MFPFNQSTPNHLSTPIRHSVTMGLLLIFVVLMTGCIAPPTAPGGRQGEQPSVTPPDPTEASKDPQSSTARPSPSHTPRPSPTTTPALEVFDCQEFVNNHRVYMLKIYQYDRLNLERYSEESNPQVYRWSIELDTRSGNPVNATLDEFHELFSCYADPQDALDKYNSFTSLGKSDFTEEFFLGDFQVMNKRFTSDGRYVIVVVYRNIFMHFKGVGERWASNTDVMAATLQQAIDAVQRGFSLQLVKP